MYRQLEKNLLNINISSTCPHNMVNFGTLTAEIDWWVSGTPANFNWFRALASLRQWRRSMGGQPNFAQCLAVSWAGTLYINFGGLLPPNGILPGANSLCVQVLCSPTLSALLHGTQAVGVSQTLQRGTKNGITEFLLLVTFNRGCHLYSEGSHHVGHWSTL